MRWFSTSAALLMAISTKAAPVTPQMKPPTPTPATQAGGVVAGAATTSTPPTDEPVDEVTFTPWTQQSKYHTLKMMQLLFAALPFLNHFYISTFKLTHTHIYTRTHIHRLHPLRRHRRPRLLV